MKTIDTAYGPLTPQYSTDDLRKKDIIPMTFHPDGTPKSVPLEEQTVITTPIGDIPAELVTFHENGALSRIFPLNGKLSGYWGEEDEAAMSQPVSILTPIGPLTIKIIGAGFHDDGSLRSLTLWPGEIVTVPTPAGRIDARIGISFARDGSVLSLEPARPIAVETPAGTITAYDPDAVGINGDDNSLAFDAAGNILRVKTTLTAITAISPDGTSTSFTPGFRDSLCGNTDKEVDPMAIEFGSVTITIIQDPAAAPKRIPTAECTFFTKPFLPQLGFEPLRPCSI